jgi:uncharacterized protein YjbI with pentapeptide repeats
MKSTKELNMESVVDVLKDVNLWNSLNLYSANLRYANLNSADLYGADLCNADLSSANLNRANLNRANLNRANLNRASLRSAYLYGADLSGADLRGANLRGADLSGADLSQTKGLVSSRDWLEQFPRDKHGVIVYRAQRGEYGPPDSWCFSPGEYLTETPNPNRSTKCGCGVAFATLEWVKKTYGTSATIWKCCIHWLDLADVVVPYNTDGKARCARLELLEIVQEGA